ncbi:hypothetical protein D3C87_1750960 [compost metagenome]
MTAAFSVFRFFERIKKTRAVDDGSEQRAFADAKICNFFSKIIVSSCAISTDLEGSILSHVDDVQVGFENLIFREARFKKDRHNKLVKFSFKSALACEEVVLHELLGDRATTLGFSACRDIFNNRATYGFNADPAVF